MLAAAALWLAAGSPAQDQAADAFAARYAAAERLRAAADADPDRVRAAYAAALDAFEAEAPAGDTRRAALPAAAFAAHLAARPQRAVELYRELLAGGGDAFAVEYYLRSLLAAGRAEECLREARARVEAYGDAVDAALRGPGGDAVAAAADRLLRTGDDVGLWTYRRLAVAYGDHPLALANLALALRHVGEEVAAEATYRRAVAGAPLDALLWNDLGLFLKGVGRLDDAADALRRSLSLEDPRGSGPAATNLLLLARAGGPPPLPAAGEELAAVLRQRPDAELPRRLCIDRIVARARGRSPRRP